MKMESMRKIGGLIDDLHKSKTCLSAMAVLVERVLRDGEDVRYISDGVELLISGQTDILENAIDAIDEEVERIRAEKFELNNLDTVAAMFGVQRELVKNIVSAAVKVRRETVEEVCANAAA